MREVIDLDRAGIGVGEKGTAAAARIARRRRDNLIFTLAWCNQATLVVKAYMMKKRSS